MESIRRIFESAIFRLTIWYMIILTALSLIFSFIVFKIAAEELNRPFIQNSDQTITLRLDDNFERLRQAREDEGRRRIVSGLITFNLTVIAAGGIASYFLARRTLAPIEEALDSQSRFTSDAAHELRTPLSVMQSEIEIGLRDKKPTLQKHRSLLQSSLDEVDRLRRLTDRLLSLSNSDKLSLSAISLDEVATEAINRILPQAMAKKISIDSTVGSIKATADFETLVDTVVILLDNAVKYSPKKSQIKISAQKQGRDIRLQIKDSGPGISKDDLPYIFDRFYRADQARSKTNVEGHGLGLSIAKRSIAAMGGTIGVKSNTSGSTFTVSLKNPNYTVPTINWKIN